MPEPRWAKGADATDMNGPQKHRDILGNDRRSKTFYTGPDMAFVTTKIHAKLRLVIETLAKAHARYYDRPVMREDEETGDLVEIGREPDVLTDEQVIERYSLARLWNDISNDFDARMVSNDGFSVKAVSNIEDEQGSQGQQESSSRSSPQQQGITGKQNTRMQ